MNDCTIATSNNMTRNASERVVCNLCGSRNLRSWFAIESKKFYNSDKSLRDVYTIARCDDCALVFVKEIPSEAELKDVYGEGYYTGRDSVGYKNYGPASRFSSATSWLSGLLIRVVRALKSPDKIANVVTRAIRRRNPRPWPYNLVDMIEEYSEVGKVLDVGCATGIFLAAAQESGWKAHGIELSDYSSQRARDERRLDVFTGTLRQALRSGELVECSCDVVTLWDTAEHLEDPMTTFKDAWSVLKPGGILFVKTLNIDGDRAAAEGQNWHFFRPPKHLFYYSEKTLKAYFKRAGFTLAKDDNFANDVVTLAGRK